MRFFKPEKKFRKIVELYSVTEHGVEYDSIRTSMSLIEHVSYPEMTDDGFNNYEQKLNQCERVGHVECFGKEGLFVVVKVNEGERLWDVKEIIESIDYRV